MLNEHQGLFGSIHAGFCGIGSRECVATEANDEHKGPRNGLTLYMLCQGTAAHEPENREVHWREDIIEYIQIGVANVK